MEGLQMVRRIAEGRFGEVFEAIRVDTGERVAVKRVKSRRPMPGLNFDPWSRSAQREAEVLSRVRHPHVLALREHVVAGTTFLLVYEFLSWDLATVLELRRPLCEGSTKAVMRMLLLGLAHLHSLGVMHRDLKPANLLLEGGTGLLKIADFGSSRFCFRGARRAEEEGLIPPLAELATHCKDEPLTRDICTRWYKSPEMLFGSVDYTCAVDLWATGCVFAELLSPEAQAAFRGVSDLEQLCLIFQAVGTPSVEDWPEVRRLPDYHKVSFNTREPRPMDVEQHCSPEAAALLRAFLRLNPAQRIAAAAALEHPCFAAEPRPVEPSLLVQGLSEADRRVDEGPPTPMGQGDCGSDDSGLCLHGAGDFEVLDIETTACGLWDDAELEAADSPEHEERDGSGRDAGRPELADLSEVPAAAEPRRTPSPPRGGEGHRLKAGR